MSPQFPGYVSPIQLRWRQPKSWRELEQKQDKISGLRVRWAKRDAFLSPAPQDKHNLEEYPVALSSDARLDELTVWRQARLLEVGRRGVVVELEGGGGHMNLTSLDGFEILIETEG